MNSARSSRPWPPARHAMETFRRSMSGPIIGVVRDQSELAKASPRTAGRVALRPSASSLEPTRAGVLDLWTGGPGTFPMDDGARGRRPSALR